MPCEDGEKLYSVAVKTLQEPGGSPILGSIRETP